MPTDSSDRATEMKVIGCSYVSRAPREREWGTHVLHHRAEVEVARGDRSRAERGDDGRERRRMHRLVALHDRELLDDDLGLALAEPGALEVGLSPATESLGCSTSACAPHSTTRGRTIELGL